MSKYCIDDLFLQRKEHELDQQIAFLTTNPNSLSVHWMNGIGLFDFVPGECGNCIMMLRTTDKKEKRSPITEIGIAIQTDSKLPDWENVYDPPPILVTDLSRFKYWWMQIFAKELEDAKQSRHN